MIGHVRYFFQVHEHPFPFNPPIILQGIPNDLTCFLNKPLHVVINQIIPLSPKTTMSPKHLCRVARILTCLLAKTPSPRVDVLNMVTYLNRITPIFEVVCG